MSLERCGVPQNKLDELIGDLSTISRFSDEGDFEGIKGEFGDKPKDTTMMIGGSLSEMKNNQQEISQRFREVSKRHESARGYQKF